MSKQEAGYIEYIEKGTDKVLARVATNQCCHCGAQWPARPLKPILKTYTALEAQFLEQQGKKMRGWCSRCNGPVCGPACAECVPQERLLENMEQGLPLDFRPIIG